MPALLVAFDLETTGLSPRSDRIIEVGAVRFRSDGAVVDRLDLLVDPGVPIPLAIQRLTGLAESDLRGCPTPEEAVAVLADFCEGAHLVAHGGAFDLAFCTALLPGAFADRSLHDTLELARILLPVAPSHSLPVLSGHLAINHERPHRAGSDAEATRALLLRLVEVAEELPADTLRVVRSLLEPVRTPLRAFFAELVGGDGVLGRPALSGARSPSRSARPRQLADTLGAAPLEAAAAAALGPDGPMAALPGYELREAQVAMSRAVAQTLERSGELLVEAGTGTGKSLAYLVPLALWAERSGRRAVVATHTVTLQEQLAERDLPAVCERLGLELSTAMLKGRQHQISLRRWQRFLATAEHGAHGPDLETLRFKLKLLCWLAQTTTGDRAELRLSGAEEALWRRVASDVDDCLGSACANWRDRRCFMVVARRAAADADIVITNHALLLADAERQGQVLAPYSALVVDEAQHLEDAATRQLGVRLRAQDVLGVIDRLLPASRSAPPQGAVEAALLRAREATQQLFGATRGHIGTSLGLDNPGNATLALSAQARQDPGAEGLARTAVTTIRLLRTAAAALLEGRGRQPLQRTFLPQPERRDDELDLAASALGEFATAVERVLCEPREGHVAWLELRAEQSELREAPVTVAEVLREHVFDRVEATVLTSATLAVAGGFEFMRSRTGLEGAEALALPAPFDYLRQALTVLPRDVPTYDDPGYDAVLAEMVTDVARRLEGRTLVLFTSYAPLRSAHNLLSSRLGEARIAVLGQGLDGTRRQVLSSFVHNPRTVLLGTSTFWEGIDLPGDVLRCVVIAKLPFPVPSDPLVQARAARLGDPFAQYALPVAVLRLKQGFGRLIRRGADRGAVVLCDARLQSREYGRTFLRALPEALAVRTGRHEVGRVVEAFVRTGALPGGAAPLRLRDLDGGAWGGDDAADQLDPAWVTSDGVA